MPRDDDDDLFDGEFDFVDDDDFDSDVDDSNDESDDDSDEKPVKKRKTVKKKVASSSTPRKKAATPAPKKKTTKKKSAPRKKKSEAAEDESEEDDTAIPARAFADDFGEQTAAKDLAEEVIDATEVDEPDSDPETEGDEYGRVEPKRDFVVHVYEHRKFHRTLAFEFTPEDAAAFADTFNKTGRPYGRFAVPARSDTPAKPLLAP